MITLGELENRRTQLKKRISTLRRLRIERDGLTEAQKDEFDRLREELDIVEFNLDRHEEMNSILLNAEPYGGPQ